MRSGTLPHSLVVGFGAACDIAGCARRTLVQRVVRRVVRRERVSRPRLSAQARARGGHGERLCSLVPMDELESCAERQRDELASPDAFRVCRGAFNPSSCAARVSSTLAASICRQSGSPCFRLAVLAAMFPEELAEEEVAHTAAASAFLVRSGGAALRVSLPQRYPLQLPLLSLSCPSAGHDS